MRAALAEAVSIAVLVFAVGSMFSVGLAYSLRKIVGPLREVRGVFRALVANFVLVPLLAVGIERTIPLDPPLALGLFLLAGSAGAPFLIKLARASRSDLAVSAALLVLLVPVTVVFLPFYVPLAMMHPSLKSLSYVPGSVLALGVPLLVTMIVPVVVGLLFKRVAPRAAPRLLPILGPVTTASLLVIVVGSIAGNLGEVLRILKSGAVVASVLLIAGAFVVGFLLTREERSSVLGLGTAQRNIAAAMVVASRDFRDPDILLMVTVTSIVGLLVLFPIAWLLSRRTPKVGPPFRPALASRVAKPA